MRRNRILILTDSLERGGAERQMFQLIKGLSNRVDFALWSMHNGSFHEEFKELGIPIQLHTGRKNIFSLSSGINRMLKSFKPDVVHAWGSAGLVAAFPPLLFTRIPVINGIIRNSNPPSSLMLKFRYALIRLFTNLWVSNSQAGLDAYKIPCSSGIVIRNGFDLSRTISRSNNTRSRKPVQVVMTANITPNKDYLSFIKAAELTANKCGNSKCTFLCIGEPSTELLWKNTNRTASSLIEIGRMRFLRGINDVIPYLADASIGVMLSLNKEGISNSIMEYMASGLPVICSDVPGNHELVTNDTGFFVKDNDPEEISRIILYLIEHSDVAKKMGQAGKERIANSFSQKNMEEAYFSLYSRLA